MSSRRYIKRVWRVPKDRGASAYLAAIVVKSLVKHGWPAKSVQSGGFLDGFCIALDDGRRDYELPTDFASAVSIAVRIAARTYRVDVSEDFGIVTFNRPYIVTDGGHFREQKT